MDFLNLKDEEDKDLSNMSREELQALAKSYGLTDEPIKVVEVDSLVVLKIIKHCLESPTDSPTGTLLGLDVSSTLQVTNSFPLPSSSSSSQPSSAQSSSSAANLDYQTQTMLLLRDVSLDYSTVGWYTSSTFGYLPYGLVPHQFNFQSTIPKSIFLIFDPLKFSHGILSLRAYRLQASFMKGYRGEGWTEGRVFEEVEVKVNGIGQGSGLGVWEKLGLGSMAEGERGVENIVDEVDRLARDQKSDYWHKKRRERKEEDGDASRDTDGGVDGRMMRGQVESYCNEVLDYANDSFLKMYIAQGMFFDKSSSSTPANNNNNSSSSNSSSSNNTQGGAMGMAKNVFYPNSEK